jgi:tetratricopeptide (TPR) repeat protein
LNRSGSLGRYCLPHLYAAYERFYHDPVGLSVSYLKSLPNTLGFLTPSERIAELILNANLAYGQGDPSKNVKLLKWMDELLFDSKNLYLRARALEFRVAVSFYEAGDYAGGSAKLDSFLKDANQVIDSNPTSQNELINAQVGTLRVRYAEYLCTEVSTAAEYGKSLELLQSWMPLNPQLPSRKELVTISIQARMLGKLFKDHGECEKSEIVFKKYLSEYGVKGSQEEGWAAGDLAHSLMEMDRAPEAEEILIKYLTPRHAFRNPMERTADRRSDTMYLEMLLGECFLLQKQYDKAERIMKELQSRFNTFEFLAHFERFRYFFVLTALARCYHLTDRFLDALGYWKLALKYCVDDLNVEKQEGKWSRNTLFPNIVLLSIADCYFELDNMEESWELQKEAETVIRSCAPTRWVLGLGTYWLRWVEHKMAARDKSSTSTSSI